MSSTAAAPATSDQGYVFEHEALLYADQDQFLAGTSAFIREGVEDGEPILVVVDAGKIALLREELGDDAEAVQFADMAGVGANPARIIPAWREFVDRHGGGDRPIRGIGEPIWPERTAPEMAECHRHEALLNLAFADCQSFRLLCPYDTKRLDADVLDRAHCNHPLIVEGATRGESGDYSGLGRITAPFADPLPAPAKTPRDLPFHHDTVRLVRRFVAAHAVDAGLRAARVEDLVLAIDELATNSVRHGGGEGVLSVWREDDLLLCEVSDRGFIDDPLVGRVKPTGERIGGFGMWMANQLCDLVQVRTSRAGTTVRVHTHLS
jgi:anti-sigma regulatory factor (Ser/Thr protein kinase)